MWTDYGGNPALDEYTTPTTARNVHSKTNATDAALSEIYGYNDLDESTSVKDSSNNVKQSWNLDGLGNWGTFTDGATTDTKTFDAANQETTSTASVTSQYDDAGNAIVTAKPGDETTALNCVYELGTG